MTVEELIKELSGFDQKADVLRATKTAPLMVTSTVRIESMDSYSPEREDKVKCPIII